jgi:CubicO group peptidase (beta-lactamase class C family)
MASRFQFLPRTTPEARGIPSSAVHEFIRRVDAEVDHLHSFMLLRGGAVVAEGWWAPYAAERPHVLFSLSKSFTSTAVGFAVHEGLLSVDDRVVSFFPEALPPTVSDNLAAMRVRDLLAMATGHELDTLDALFRDPDGDWARAFLARPVDRTPGTHFVYNSGATYMLSAIVQRRTGMRISEYLRPRLFDPLGIADPVWDRDPRGVDVGGWGLNITTEDIAHFGQLYLQNGEWNGRQVIPAAWVAEATRAHSDNSSNENADWKQGYGYQFWRCRHNAYRGDGAFGQYCIVMPDQDVVIAITSGIGDMQGVLNLVWETLLPAFGPAPLAEDPAAHAALRAQLAALQMPRPQGKAHSPLAASIADKRYRLEASPYPAEALSLEFLMNVNALPISAVEGLQRPADAAQVQLAADGVVLHLHTPRGVDAVAAGFADWRESRIAFTTDRPVLCSSVAAWSDDHTLCITSCLVETPFVRTHTLRFSSDGAQVELETRLNYAFGPNEPLRISGSA